MGLIFHNGSLLFVGGLPAMSSNCCCDGCCSKLPIHIYAHVTFNCASGTYTNVLDLTEAAYTGSCSVLTVGGDGVRIWEGSGLVNNGGGTLTVRFSCFGSANSTATYFACTDGCGIFSCTGCPPSSWTELSTANTCASGTLGTYSATPSPSGCGTCTFPPPPNMTIVFKTTP